ncbi:hypothetical protein M5D96_004301 [Drosophila gunungcola]|uniref:Uncharacterized protein n=1 Tax=Drosophila gunungcola TaxID=103775 RepID=A0A9Q0BSD4_9MUSC|nr:hypothetical protein M5D96_004301 [Drosophila gunungcola]
MPGLAGFRLVVRRVSNAVNISGVSNDKRMFTRVRTHPDSLLFIFYFLFATDCGGRASRSISRTSGNRDSRSQTAITWTYSSVCLYLMRQFINDGRDLPMGLMMDDPVVQFLHLTPQQQHLPAMREKFLHV